LDELGKLVDAEVNVSTERTHRLASPDEALFCEFGRSINGVAHLAGSVGVSQHFPRHF
jgi:hypothetical protein